MNANRNRNEGRGAAYSSLGRPAKLAYSEKQADEASATRRERQIKRWTRAKREALTAGDNDALRPLSRRQR